MKGKVKMGALLLILLLSLTFLAACGSGGTPATPSPTTTPDAGGSQTPSAPPAQNEEKVVNLLSWGGTIQTTFEAEGWADKFNEATGYTLVLTPKSTSAEIIATAIAQKDNPQVDVVMCDVGPFLTGVDKGIFIPISSMALTNLADMYPNAVSEYGVQPYTSAGTLIYNPTYFSAKGWDAPQAWTDLLDPKYAGEIVLNPPNVTYGLFALVELARANGGGEANIEPGFEALRQLAPNVVEWPSTYSQIGEYMQNGTANFAVTEYVAAIDLRKKGIDIELLIPESGAFASPVMIGAMEGCKHPIGAQLFIDFMMSPEFLLHQANQYGKGSYNKLVEDMITPEQAPFTLTGKVDQLHDLDWSTVNQSREAWVERFEKEIAPLTGTAK